MKTLLLAFSLLFGGISLAAPAKGTEILWDRYGVPHIFAPDHPSLFYTYGYAQMEAHSELLLRLYTQARGRGAEFYGEQYLDSDRWIRLNGVPARAKQWAAQQSPSLRRCSQRSSMGSTRGAKSIPTPSARRRRLPCRCGWKTFWPMVCA